MAYIDPIWAAPSRVAEGSDGHPDPSPGPCYELRFRSLFWHGRSWTFPCDAAGHVDMDSMSERARNNYMYARAVIGIEVAPPCVQVAP